MIGIQDHLIVTYEKSGTDLDCLCVARIERTGTNVLKLAYDQEAEDIYNSLTTPSTPKKDNGGWIEVTDECPKDRNWYLGIFQETDTGWVNPIPYVCDYMGKPTKATTNDGWILKGFTDIDNPMEYHKNQRCVAWQPLPPNYKWVHD